jgi:tetratricopeptide (TPR) repeat protein
LLAADVEQSLAALTVAVAQSLPAGAGEQATLERAHLLAMLGRTDAARELMRPWMERSSSAALLWAMLERDEGRWESSDEGFRRALEQMRRERAAGSQGLPPQGLRAPYDGLAFNARAQRQPQVAEQLYRQALAELPEDEAYFRFQLGLHYQLGGRPLEAQAELAAAARLDAEAYGEPARQLIDRLRVETPACLVPLPRGR